MFLAKNNFKSRISEKSAPQCDFMVKICVEKNGLICKNCNAKISIANFSTPDEPSYYFGIWMNEYFT